MSPLISTEAVYGLHRAALERHGGRAGEGKGFPCIDGSINAATSAVLYRFDTSEFVDAKWFAAYAFLYLLKNHCFVDGNKRVAWSVLMAVLFQELDSSLDVPDDEAFGIVVDFEVRAKAGADFGKLVAEFVDLIDGRMVPAAVFALTPED